MIDQIMNLIVAKTPQHSFSKIPVQAKQVEDFRYLSEIVHAKISLVEKKNLLAQTLFYVVVNAWVAKFQGNNSVITEEEKKKLDSGKKQVADLQDNSKMQYLEEYVKAFLGQ